MWWREWCVVTLFGVKRSRDKIRKLPRYDTILQNWRKRKQCNYLCQPKFIRNWVLRISVQNINYSHPLLFEITRTFVGNWIIFLIFEVLKKNFQILCFRLIIQIKVVKSQRIFSFELNLQKWWTRKCSANLAIRILGHINLKWTCI